MILLNLFIDLLIVHILLFKNLFPFGTFNKQYSKIWIVKKSIQNILFQFLNKEKRNLNKAIDRIVHKNQLFEHSKGRKYLKEGF